MNANKQDAGGLPDYADALQVVDHVLRLIDEKVMLTKARERCAASSKRAEASEQAYTLMCGHGEAIRDALRRNGEQCRAASGFDLVAAMESWHGALDSAKELAANAPDERYRKRASDVVAYLATRAPNADSALSRGVPEGK